MKRLRIIFDRLPIDLALVIALTLACILFVLASRLDETPVRVLLGLLLVLFLPGYSLIAALFPRKDDLDGIERIALSFGLSIAVVPLIGLALNYTPFGIRLVPVLAGLSVFTILLAVVACVRRGRRQGRWAGVSEAGVIVTVVHDEFRGMGLSGVHGFIDEGAVVVDVRGMFDAREVVRMGVLYEQDEQITSYAQRLPKRPCTRDHTHALMHTVCTDPSTE